MGIFSLTQELAIDLGTANTLIIYNGKVVVDEPSIVALDVHTGKLVAIGQQARQMHEKTNPNIKTIRPLKDGVIADFNATELMLRGMIKKVKTSGSLFAPSLRMVICRPTICRSESGRWVELPQLDVPALADIEFKIESEDPYWAKLQGILHGWTIAFSLYGGGPELPNGGPVGNWMGIRPVHCREVVAFFLNFTYMIDMPQHEVILRENQDRLYGNGGVEDKVTPETVLAQMRQPRSLIVGLVYPGHGVIGLGGGYVFGAYQTAWLNHYTNTYSCEIMFHELGHVMGYSHDSSFTYGPWAQELMNNFYVEHLGEMPIDSSTYLNTSKNPTLYP